MRSIHNANLLLPNRIIYQGWISFENETISATGVGTPPRIDESFDAEGLYLAPGFIDLHVHGGCGADFLDATAEAFATISRFHVAGGTTALAPTGATSTYQQFEVLLAMAGKVVTAGRLLPVHLEGPHLAETKAGAQNKALFTYPQRQQIDWLVSRASQIGTVTVAPGNGYSISTFSCPAGSTIAFELSSVQGTSLTYFQDYNPCPIGLYITAG
jgi:N-acetylglucosamine-6-phosphate deacetylase